MLILEQQKFTAAKQTCQHQDNIPHISKAVRDEQSKPALAQQQRNKVADNKAPSFIHYNLHWKGNYTVDNEPLQGRYAITKRAHRPWSEGKINMEAGLEN